MAEMIVKEKASTLSGAQKRQLREFRWAVRTGFFTSLICLARLGAIAVFVCPLWTIWKCN